MEMRESDTLVKVSPRACEGASVRGPFNLDRPRLQSSGRHDGCSCVCVQPLPPRLESLPLHRTAGCWVVIVLMQEKSVGWTDLHRTSLTTTRSGRYRF